VEGRLFTLVDAAEYDDIFAWGMEITHPDGRAAVIYRWDPTTRQSTLRESTAPRRGRGFCTPGWRACP
jgi:hypothetical protein